MARELTQRTYGGWRAALNRVYGVGGWVIEGDADIASAFAGGACVGEWDGAAGRVTRPAPPATPEPAPARCGGCGEPLDTDCNGRPRCPDCDGPCPCCSDGGGPGADDVTPAEFAAAVESMRAAGERDGREAGGWVADGNTPEPTLRGMLRAWDEGDPDERYHPRAPFSGEWADSPGVRDVIGSETDLDPDTLEPEEEDELASAYEDAYSAAWYIEAERTVRGLLPDEPADGDPPSAADLDYAYGTHGGSRVGG